MSATATQLAYDEALFAAEKFRALFAPTAYESWTIAGSVRRRCRDINDIEHVVVPRWGDVPGDDMYKTPQRVNLVLHRLDELLSSVQITQHRYGDGHKAQVRWGSRYRGCRFDCLGVRTTHEVFLADNDNHGSCLAIRTGPADFSKRLVVGLRRNGYRNLEGYVVKCATCATIEVPHRCHECRRVSVPTEREYFELAGMAFIEPEDRR